MSIGLLHHRLAVLAALLALIAYAGGAGPAFATAPAAGALLVLAFFWQPALRTMERLERLWLPLALLLVARALYHAVVLGDDVILPVVDLLLLLLVAEAFRPPGAQNDARLYALSFALVLAATAYRPGPLFLFGFGGFLVVGTVGLMVGHLKRQSARRELAPPVLSRRFLASAVWVSGGVLVAAGAVFVLFPRPSQAWPGRLGAPPAAVAGFQDRVAIGDHGSTILPNPAVVLRVEFPSGRPAGPLYWRGRSYDRFDGESWSRSRRVPPSAGRRIWYEERWGGEIVEQTVYASRLNVRVLFALHPLIRVRADSPIQPIFDNAGDYTYWGSTAPVYSAFSVVGQPSPDELRAAAGSFYPGRELYVQLPTLDDRIRALADSLSAGRPSRYDRVAAVLDFFGRDFGYTLELPATRAEATLEHFLFERRAGHCEYYSTAMVMLLRSMGIQSREVNGFLGGEWNEFGGYLAVTQNQAHTWVEVWFPGLGWVPFDPTPPGGAAAAAALSWNWPGRFFLDGLRHRWNKWVLDYDSGSQVEILGTVREALAAESVAAERRASPYRWGLVFVLVVLGAAGFMIVRRAGRGRSPVGPESALFLKLRKACVRAGVPDAARAPASHLPAVLGSHGWSSTATGAVQRFVDLYLHARFHADGLSPERRAEMEAAARGARKAVRSRRLVGTGEWPHM